MKRSPRIILKLCAFVLAGAIINVAVAWGCVKWSPTTKDGTRAEMPTTEERDWWSRHKPEGFKDHVSTRSRWDGLGVGVSWLCKGYNMPGSGSTFDQHVSESCSITRSGLPLHSLERLIWERKVNSARPTSLEPSIPVRPIWPGFAINTVFYAAMLWLLFYDPGLVRRRVRSMRGCCRACGYSLHNRAPDSTRCPECGATV